MKKLILIVIAASFYYSGIAQETGKDKIKSREIIQGLAENACKCIDSIEVSNKSNEEISNDINKCIDNEVVAYQASSKLMNIIETKINSKDSDIQKPANISINVNKNSPEYKEYYYEMERYLMDSCKALKIKVATNNKQSDKSFSKDPKANEWYSNGIAESNKENYSKAIEYFKEALAVDPEFAFAWDNLGVCYRKIGDYDKALNAYEKSLSIDPNGLLPLQNIGIVYQYKKEFKKAINAYERLAEVDKNNPEVYYGIGQIYTFNLVDYEKGLDNMCKAYNLYIVQKSPYRTDAEKIIQTIYSEMKKQGKEDKFNEILKANNITPK
jgi:tetratricopeptide (TPR) repeat protein